MKSSVLNLLNVTRIDRHLKKARVRNGRNVNIVNNEINAFRLTRHFLPQLTTYCGSTLRTVAVNVSDNDIDALMLYTFKNTESKSVTTVYRPLIPSARNCSHFIKGIFIITTLYKKFYIRWHERRFALQTPYKALERLFDSRYGYSLFQSKQTTKQGNYFNWS